MTRPGQKLPLKNKKKNKRNANSIWCSQAVTHPSTNQTQRCLTAGNGSLMDSTAAWLPEVASSIPSQGRMLSGLMLSELPQLATAVGRTGYYPVIHCYLNRQPVSGPLYPEFTDGLPHSPCPLWTNVPFLSFVG